MGIANLNLELSLTRHPSIEGNPMKRYLLISLLVLNAATASAADSGIVIDGMRVNNLKLNGFTVNAPTLNSLQPKGSVRPLIPSQRRQWRCLSWVGERWSARRHPHGWTLLSAPNDRPHREPARCSPVNGRHA